MGKRCGCSLVTCFQKGGAAVSPLLMPTFSLCPIVGSWPSLLTHPSQHPRWTKMDPKLREGSNLPDVAQHDNGLCYVALSF